MSSMPIILPTPAMSGRAGGRWRVAEERVWEYLRAAGLDEEQAWRQSGLIVDRCAQGTDVDSTDDAVLMALQQARLELFEGEGEDATARGITPPSQPLHMRPRPLGSVVDWRRAAWHLRRMVMAREPEADASGAQDSGIVARSSARRRLAFTVLILFTTFWGTNIFLGLLAVDGLSLLDIAHTAVFAVLLLWLAQSFWTLSAGAGVQLRRIIARHGRATTAAPAATPLAGTQRTALVMPIYNEGTDRVLAGLRAMWEDMAAAGPGSQRFDLFILSDTTDPDVWLAEIEAWQALRAAVPGGERIFYRRRLRNKRRKTGNIEDFISRWGKGYAYMLVLDADSLMTGEAILTLAERMDANPRVGLIQAPPKLVRGRSLFARALQTAGELYGPLAATGVSYWSMGEGNYWGHNAIIRVDPFVKLCGLPLLPGRAPLGGEILSHDFVEAALMRRGGWQVWIADDLGGSYEEPPPSIEDFATRDRRWCQGNLQHIQVLFAKDLHWVSRLHLAIGIMSYITSPLWLIFLLLSAAQAWELTYGRPVYFLDGWPFPVLPVSMTFEATLLLTVTLGLLFVPKVMGIVLALVDGPRRRQLGGGFRLVASALIETLFSALVAPVMMLMHTRIVSSILFGAATEWKPQRRQAGGSDVMAAVRTFGWVTVLGLVATVGVAMATPILIWWVVPVVAGLLLIIPLALLASHDGAGDWLRRHGLLLITEETAPPAVIQRLDELESGPTPARRPDEHLIRVVMDPRRNALHTDLLLALEPGTPGSDHQTMLARKAIYLGPGSLDKAERRALLEDRHLLRRLHLEAWVYWPKLGIAL
jgi:membrane glycosyltransferase